MIQNLLFSLWHQAVLLSFGAVLLLALRPILITRLGARATYAAWLLLPALLATLLLPRWSQAPLPALVHWSGAVQTAAATLLTSPPSSDASVWPQVLLAAWLGGASCVLLWQARRQWQLARLGTVLPPGSSPALVGVLRPRVALPADFETRFTPSERQLVLDHEEVHRTRHDNAWNLLACLMTALHWWNPLAWLASHRMRADQELACDAVVLASHPGALEEYARALLAAHGLTRHGAPLASRWGTAHPLVERVALLKRAQAPRQRRDWLWLAAAMLGATTTGYALQWPSRIAPLARQPLTKVEYDPTYFMRTPYLSAAQSQAGKPAFALLKHEVMLTVGDTAVYHSSFKSAPLSGGTLTVLTIEAGKPRLWKLDFHGERRADSWPVTRGELALNEDAVAVEAWTTGKVKDVPYHPVPLLLRALADGNTYQANAMTPDGRHPVTLELRVTPLPRPSGNAPSDASTVPQPGSR